jgi:hypothetical protein
VLVEADADQLEVARLLLAEQVAGTAQVEVAGADREAGAEVVEHLHGAKALERRGRDLGARLREQHDIAARAAPADAAAKLMKLGEPEHVGAPDQHRVGARDVEARFDDVGGEQDIAVAGGEAHHFVVDLCRGHPAVGFAKGELGHHPGELLGHRAPCPRSAARPGSFARRGGARAAARRARLGRKGGDSVRVGNPSRRRLW